MKMIAAVDSRFGIGKDGKLLVSIPNDMKHFRAETTGRTVILGRKTLATFPGGKPLAGRRNIILTKNPSFTVPGAEVAHSVEEALAMTEDTPSDDVIVIGGEQVYRAFLPYADTAILTMIDFAYEADAYFPDLEADPEWEVAEEGEEQTCFDIIYRFVTYRRKV